MHSLQARARDGHTPDHGLSLCSSVVASPGTMDGGGRIGDSKVSVCLSGTLVALKRQRSQYYSMKRVSTNFKGDLPAGQKQQIVDIFVLDPHTYIELPKLHVKIYM
ncbi:hypothetical protein ACQ4PT_057859 [Festuca glaucescens]